MKRSTRNRSNRPRGRGSRHARLKPNSSSSARASHRARHGRSSKSRWGLILAIAAILGAVALTFALQHNPPQPAPNRGRPAAIPPDTGGKPGAQRSGEDAAPTAPTAAASQPASETTDAKVAHLNSQANDFLKKGDLQNAEALYQKAIAVAPDNESLRFNLGIVLQSLGQITNAETQYREALRVDPDFSEAHNNLGELLLKQDEPDKAITQFQAAIHGKPNYPLAHNNLAVAYRQVGKTDQAITNFQQALQEQPDYWRAHYNLGKTYLSENNYAYAIDEFQAVLKLRPGFTPAVQGLRHAESLLEPRVTASPSTIPGQ